MKDFDEIRNGAVATLVEDKMSEKEMDEKANEIIEASTTLSKAIGENPIERLKKHSVILDNMENNLKHNVGGLITRLIRYIDDVEKRDDKPKSKKQTHSDEEWDKLEPEDTLVDLEDNIIHKVIAIYGDVVVVKYSNGVGMQHKNVLKNNNFKIVKGNK